MKDQTISVLVLLPLFASVLAGCTTAISSLPVGIETQDVTLPISVENVWYRTDEIRLLGLAYEESGTITVSESGVEFAHEGGKVGIPSESIRRVVWGKLSPDIVNDWVIVYWAGSGKEEVAAFKGTPFSGGGKDSKIYSSILRSMNAK